MTDKTSEQNEPLLPTKHQFVQEHWAGSQKTMCYHKTCSAKAFLYTYRQKQALSINFNPLR